MIVSDLLKVILVNSKKTIAKIIVESKVRERAIYQNYISIQEYY